MSTVLRLLRTVIGYLLAVLAVFATLIAAFAFIAMFMVWWQEGRLNEHDLALLRGGGCGVLAGALFAWAGFRLAHGGRRSQAVRQPFFRLVRSESGRQERFVEIFVLFVYLVFFGAWLWSRIDGEPWARGFQVAGWLGVIYLGLHVRILLHELGHLGAARLLRLELATLRVGAGPRLWGARGQGGLRWEWRLRPSGGWVEAYHRDEAGFRWRQFVFVAGGPLVDALVIGGLWLMLRQPGGQTPLPGMSAGAGLSVLFVLFAAVGLSAVIGLVPHRMFIGDRSVFSDGWWLCRVFFVPAGTVRGWVRAHAVARIAWLWDLGRHEEARGLLVETATRYPEQRANWQLIEGRMYRQMKANLPAAACFRRALEESAETSSALRPHVVADLAAALAAAGQPERAREECAAALAQPATEEERATLLDALACLPILHEETRALLPDADRWCAEALALGQERVTVRGTKGALLIEAGRNEEGAAVLREVLAATHSDNDRGIAAFYLALAAHRLGRPKESRAYRRTAQRLCQHPVLRGRLLTELPAG